MFNIDVKFLGLPKNEKLALRARWNTAENNRMVVS